MTPDEQIRMARDRAVKTERERVLCRIEMALRTELLCPATGDIVEAVESSVLEQVIYNLRNETE